MKKFLLSVWTFLLTVLLAFGFAACSGDESGSFSGNGGDSGSSETAGQYTVTYNANGGTFEDEQTTLTATVEANATLTAPESPKRANYTFDGWATSALGANKWNFGTDKVTGNVTLYAVWTQQSAAILSVDGASIEEQEIFMFVDKDTDSVSLASKVVCSDDSVWKLYYDKLGQMEIPTKIAASASGELLGGDNVFYMVVTSKDGLQTNLYEINVYRSYAVSVNYYDEETLLKTETVYTGYEYEVDYEPEITGYTFNGWGYTTRVLWDTLNLYADKTAHTYTVTCNVNGGSELTNTQITVTYGSNYSLAKIGRRGYTFLGWYYGDVQMTDEKGESLTAWKDTENLTLTAEWQANTYTVTLVRSIADGGSVSGGGEHVYDSNVRITASPKNGYTWLGWYDEDDELVTMEFSYDFQMGLHVEYTAKWMVCPVTIEKGYWWEGTATDLTQTVTVLGAQTTITASVETGYTWLGWYSGETLLTNELSYTFEMSTANVTYTAKWERYAATTNTNLSNAGTYTGLTNTGIAAGTETTITAITNRGYAWLGWYDGTTLLTNELSYTFEMPAKNVTYTAKWEMREEMENFNFTSTATTCTITGIKDKTVAEIVVPDYVTQINGGVFSGCSNLTSITVPFVGGSVKTEKDTYQYPFGYIFGEVEYAGCMVATPAYYGNTTNYTTTTWYYIPAKLKTVTVTGGNILCGAFHGCNKLESITLPDNVTSIGIQAFYDCSGLTSITIPDSVTTIGGGAFRGCSKLTDVTISDNVTSIGEQAFASCSQLQRVTLGTSLKEINYNTFSGCTALTGITIPDNITTIGGSAFYNSGLTNVTIGSGVTTIGTSAFQFCARLTSIEIPNNVISIGNQAFYGCGLANVTIGSGVTRIDASAFANCSNLTSVTVPDNVTSIGAQAFYDCSGLTSVAIGSGATSIDGSAFIGCSSLTSITVDEKNTAYKSIDGNLYTKDERTLVRYAVGKTETSFTVPDSVTTIGYSAFSGCVGLTSVTLGDGVTSIGHSAFYGCVGLTSVTVPDNVTSIGDHAFSGCVGLTSVTLGDGVTTIGYSAFRDCSGLTRITIPESVTSIAYYAFYNCSSLTRVSFDDTSTWYRTTSSTNWNNKKGGESTDVTSEQTNATYFKSTYYNYYWYKK